MINRWKTIIILMALWLVTGCNNAPPSADIAPINSLPTVMPTAANTSITATVAQPETALVPVMSFKLSGGIAGFCNELSISATGDFKMSQPCKAYELKGTLKGDDLTTFQGWLKDFAEFQWDSPAQTGADMMTTQLIFKGQGATVPDEAQKTVILDWVSGLTARMQPPPPTPTPPVMTSGAVCPTMSRPAILVDDYDNPYRIVAVDPNNQTTCDIVLAQPPLGRMAMAQGSIFFPVFDKTAKTVTVWQLQPNGQQAALEFTRVTVDEPFYPFNFAVSADGRKIAWARAVIQPAEADKQPPYQNDMWVANVDGSGVVALMQQVLNNENRYAVPIRFASDNSTLYYAMQPNGLGGSIFSFVGKYDTVYQLPVAGGEAKLIYACNRGQVDLCIGDISADGSTLAYTDAAAKAITLIQVDGTVINSFSGSGQDYIGQPTFAPNGNLAFISIIFNTAAESGQPPLPNPGTISFVAAPYTGEAQTILADNSVLTVWEWLDETHVVYGLDSAEHFNPGVGLVSTAGVTATLSTNFPLGVWR